MLLELPEKFYENVEEIRIYYEDCLNVISKLECQAYSDVVSFIKAPKKPKLTLNKLLQKPVIIARTFNNSQTYQNPNNTGKSEHYVSLRVYFEECLHIISRLQCEEYSEVIQFVRAPQKPAKITLNSLLRKLQQVTPSSTAKLPPTPLETHKTLLCYLNPNSTSELERYISLGLSLFGKKRSFKSRDLWLDYLASINTSSAYSNNLIAIYKIVREFPRLRQLHISYTQFVKIKSRIIKMVEVVEYNRFWKKV